MKKRPIAVLFAAVIGAATFGLLQLSVGPSHFVVAKANADSMPATNWRAPIDATIAALNLNSPLALKQAAAAKAQSARAQGSARSLTRDDVYDVPDVCTDQQYPKLKGKQAATLFNEDGSISVDRGGNPNMPYMIQHKLTYFKFDPSTVILPDNQATYNFAIDVSGANGSRMKHSSQCYNNWVYNDNGTPDNYDDDYNELVQSYWEESMSSWMAINIFKPDGSTIAAFNVTIQ